jgi:ParB family chromosome partitioning protein
VADKDKRLGRGLESLFSMRPVDVAAGASPTGDILHIPLDQVGPNPKQPREQIAAGALAELVASIREHGVLQPVIVRPAKEGYELVAGERRWRACREAGLPTVPAVVRDVPDGEALVIALVENLQREDLNAIEKAKGFKDLGQAFGLTQEDLSRRTGVERSTIANFLRLLDLPPDVQALVSRGTISMGHARALIPASDPAVQLDICRRIVRDDLSVRDVERIVGGMASRAGRRSAVHARRSAHIRDLEDRLRDRVGLKVAIQVHGGRGRVIFHFAGDADLQRLLDLLGVDIE